MLGDLVVAARGMRLGHSLASRMRHKVLPVARVQFNVCVRVRHEHLLVARLVTVRHLLGFGQAGLLLIHDARRREPSSTSASTCGQLCHLVCLHRLLLQRL